MNDEKDISFIFGGKNIHFKIEKESYDKFKTLCIEQNLTVKEVLSSFITQHVAKYDGGLKLDNYFDPNFIPEPTLSDSIEKIIKWVQKQSIEKQKEFRDEFYRLHIMSKAIIDDPNNISLDYIAAWRRYK